MPRLISKNSHHLLALNLRRRGQRDSLHAETIGPLAEDGETIGLAGCLADETVGAREVQGEVALRVIGRANQLSGRVWAGGGRAGGGLGSAEADYQLKRVGAWALPTGLDQVHRLRPDVAAESL